MVVYVHAFLSNLLTICVGVWQCLSDTVTDVTSQNHYSKSPIWYTHRDLQHTHTHPHAQNLGSLVTLQELPLSHWRAAERCHFSVSAVYWRCISSCGTHQIKWLPRVEASNVSNRKRQFDHWPAHTHPASLPQESTSQAQIVINVWQIEWSLTPAKMCFINVSIVLFNEITRSLPCWRQNPGTIVRSTDRIMK